MILSSVRLVTSIYPFDCGCLGDENWFLFPRPEQKFLKLRLLNCRQLSDMIVCGILNLQIMFFHTKLWIFPSIMVANASASTHFMKKSIATNRKFTCHLPWGNGPTMLIPDCANGQGEDIVVSLLAGRHWTFPNLWHLSHFLMSSLASTYMVGQN